ncbi:MAG TPA: TlpA disulfide reductase family protein [Candidatus Acidoferrales bacterium]|nr:TlpA disulfide reductase family protein [Candidatus Acidoferrales bacterium]
MKSRFARIADIAAIALIALAAWKFLIAPRFFGPSFHPVPAPPLTLPLEGGGTFTLAKDRGQVVFLDFWASWCEPCKMSIPLIEKYKTTHPGALVYSIDAGESESVASRYARSAKMRRVAFDPNMKAADSFGVDVFPTMIVIGRDGKEHAKWIGFNPLIEHDMARAAKEF